MTHALGQSASSTSHHAAPAPWPRFVVTIERGALVSDVHTLATMSQRPDFLASLSTPLASVSRYEQGLVSSYTMRGRQAIVGASALLSRAKTEDGRSALHAELRRASELLCKAVRVSRGTSASRSRDVRELVFGVPGIVEPLPECPQSARLATIASMAEAFSSTPSLGPAWLAQLEALAAECASLRATTRPRRASFHPGARTSESSAQRDRARESRAHALVVALGEWMSPSVARTSGRAIAEALTDRTADVTDVVRRAMRDHASAEAPPLDRVEQVVRLWISASRVSEIRRKAVR